MSRHLDLDKTLSSESILFSKNAAALTFTLWFINHEAVVHSEILYWGAHEGATENSVGGGDQNQESEHDFRRFVMLWYQLFDKYINTGVRESPILTGLLTVHIFSQLVFIEKNTVTIQLITVCPLLNVYL